MKMWVPRGSAWIAFAVGIAALLLCASPGMGTKHDALLSYLYTFLFFTGLSTGSMALAMIPALTGGAWAAVLRPALLAAAQLVKLQAVLALPLLLNLHALYIWADRQALTGDAQLRAQSWYLDPRWFAVRTLIYFGVWILVAQLLSRRRDSAARRSALAAPGLIAYVITASLAAVDWVMSLTPHWHSSVFGLMVAAGWLLTAAAAAILWATGFARPATPISAPLLRDLGNVLLALVLGWSYLGFVQYLTIWSTDLPAETSWYIPRTMTSWKALAEFLVAFHFAVPFALLLWRRIKQTRGGLIVVACMLLCASFADAFWLVLPTFHNLGLRVTWTDVLAPMGMGALWLCFFPLRPGERLA
jgi:hypothetical protein